ncbi:tRNA adenosine(34) deaminase TadA [Homoserinibacter sp. YIM 151385]|uniref:tRNA adenosine(34) deaminase TadA n=1 Tax=Homoserinibacter sp. YIM 151385 TaxID=2985506 RepID=UPI0022EFFA74|nr:tRNA adenosine(34) deaminase TadA [Homoserinibacter sp. YIM 151385]WBU37032.1 tRNA adenosine(34) deaminase TadA [Homoserinibacter sp. YIM 151385]
MRPDADDERWMRRALEIAAAATRTGDVPVGAVLLDADGAVLAEAGNERELLGDPTAHAEVLAIRRGAEARGGWRLEGATLVVTLEPCVLCAGAILAARIPRVVFGAWDEKAGAVGSVHELLRDRRLNHRVEVVAGVLAEEASAQLRAFFDAHR